MSSFAAASTRIGLEAVPPRHLKTATPLPARIPCAVLGATGLVGQHLLRLLEDHPVFEVVVVAASPANAGRLLGEVAAWRIPGELSERLAGLPLGDPSREAVLASGARVAFSALPAAAAGPLETALRAAGVGVFSNASAHRVDLDVPILIPEVNPEHLELAAAQAARFGGGFIVAGPNCATAGLALALAPIAGHRLRRAVVTTFQAVSGGGRRGVASLDVIGNVLPLIPGEEGKMARETARVLGRLAGGSVVPDGLEVVASCARVPVSDGHLQAVAVEAGEALDEAAAVAAWRGFVGAPQRLGLATAPERPLVVRGEEDRPQPALDTWAGAPERARGMAVSIGRVRRSGALLCFFLLVHNAVRGAAGACVLNAELAHAAGLVGR
jgi:aspartate-semialdehyde dehydrogenase